MATKRKRGNAWEFVVRRKKLLPKPFYATFVDEAEGDRYCRYLEKLLDDGIVPEEVRAATQDRIQTIDDVIREHLRTNVISDTDRERLNVLLDRDVRHTRLTAVNYSWAENWIRQMKRVNRLSPGSIRKYVGALARCLDWVVRKNDPQLPGNPLRQLPRNYAQYADGDGDPVVDVQRDRRLEPGEEDRIRAIMNGEKPEGRQRPFTLHHRDAIILLFDLALETGMRLREMYTLTPDQIDIKKRTIFLEKTKNGKKRQVPLSSVAIRQLSAYEPFNASALFPWYAELIEGGHVPSKHELSRVTSLLSRQFSRIFKAANVENFTEHDLRHEAACRVYERTTLSDVQIMKMFGWTDPRMCLRYANLRGSDLAAELW